MFTGIIEAIGKVEALEKRKSNLLFTIKSPIAKELKPGQSVSHNGACLTVVHADSRTHTAEAVSETLKRTNLGKLKTGCRINLERAMKANGRFDGHLVQGHIDQCGTCTAIENHNGSAKLWFSFQPGADFLIVPKGSICVDGVSLTVVDVLRNRFSVVVIPHTMEHTCLQYLKKGDAVNLEFDIVGKYVRAGSLLATN